MLSPTPVKPSQPKPSEPWIEEELSLNIIKSKTALNAESFLAQALLVGLILGAVNWFLYAHLQKLRDVGAYKALVQIYVVWFGLNTIGYMLMTRIFMRRWRAFTGTRKSTFLSTLSLQFGLLSPLIALALISVGILRSDREDKSDGSFTDLLLQDLKIFLTVIGAVLIVHLSYLGYQLKKGSLAMAGPAEAWALTPIEPTLGHSVKENLGNKKSPAFLNAFLTVHVYPHLFVAGKYAVTAFSDFERLRLLNETLEEPQFCPARFPYLGAKVENCFYEKALKMGQEEPYASTLLALLFETQYRQKIIERDQRAARERSEPVVVKNIEEMQIKQREDVVTALASQFVAVDNLIYLVDRNGITRDFTKIVSPLLLLPGLGNVELVFINFSQDFQRVAIKEKIVPMLSRQLQQIEANLKGGDVQKILLPEQFADFQKKLGSMREALESIRANPFRASSAR